MAPVFQASALPRGVFAIAEVLERAGEKAWAVGGGLRDHLLARPSSDWDLATTATPERVIALFPRTIPTGMKHGTVTVRIRNEQFEVTTLRGEGAYSDGRRPDEVYFVRDIEHDLERRDFTVNALALALPSLDLVDPFGGLADLEGRVVRAVRDPRLRFREDGLRILRGARFVATLRFTLDPATEAAIPEALDVLAKVSRERVREEFQKTMKADAPSAAFRVLARTGALATVAPALAEGPSLEAAFGAMDRARTPIVRHAALCCALGRGQGRASQALLAGLRYSTDEQRDVQAVLDALDVLSDPTCPDARARKALRALGRARVEPFLELLLATDPQAGDQADRLRQLVASTVFTPRELGIAGDAVVRLLGRAGPEVKQILDSLLAGVDEDPSRNQGEALQAEAARLVEALGR